MMHGFVMDQKIRSSGYPSSLYRHAPAVLVWRCTLRATLLQPQDILVEVELRHLDIRLIILSRIERRLLFIHYRHTTLALAIEECPFRTRPWHIQSKRLAVSGVFVEEEVPRAIRLLGSFLHNALALARLQLGKALGACGFHPWRRLALLGPQIILKTLLAFDWRRRNAVALARLFVKLGAVRTTRFIGRNTFALAGIIRITDKALLARRIAFPPDRFIAFRA
jgi:hypothetical protein